ncbi:Rv3654c family TadE-like protein [Spirillospora sp. CA-255316]
MPRTWVGGGLYVCAARGVEARAQKGVRGRAKRGPGEVKGHAKRGSGRGEGVLGERGRVVRGGEDRGAGVVWVMACMALVWVVGVAAMTVGAARVTRHRADAAADLAALGAAARALEGREVACRAAATVVRKSGGRLSACSVHDRIADVSVVMVLRVPFEISGLHVVSRARAGPVARESVPLTARSRCTKCQ